MGIWKEEISSQAGSRGVRSVLVSLAVLLAVGWAAATHAQSGSVTLFPAEPRVGTVLRVRLSDPDGIVGFVNWKWAKSSDKSSWSEIRNTVGASYTPVPADADMYLQATATYKDGQGSGKTAAAESDSTVGAREPAPELTVVPLVSGLTIPWGLAFTPNGRLLFTERGGKLSSRLTNGTVQTVSADFSDLFVLGESGLMAIVVDPDFASKRRFYTCQAHTGPEVQVIAWTFDDDTYTAATRANDPLVENIPASTFGRHSGCRLRFGPEGPEEYLWIATGDAAAGTTPQDLTSLGGKVLRVNASTGDGALTNPFASWPLIYTYGHRNVQGLALRPGTSQMWTVEHGPSIDDEINLLVADGNYGWKPGPGYNESVPMTDLVQFPSAIAAKWASGDPTLATSGGIFLEGEDWGEWEGRLAVATLAGRSLRIFEFTAAGTFVSQVVVPELDDTYGRLRTPMLGPDGALYVSTSNGGGQDKILKVVPGQPPTFSETDIQEEVAENSSTSEIIATVTATDPDGETLIYTLSGSDAVAFTISDTAVGELRARVELDHETTQSYEIIVTATDPYGLSDSITLTITVTNVNEAPVVTGESSVRYTEEGGGPVYTYSASDPEQGTINWEVQGMDYGAFEIDSGVLRFQSPPDFEDPTGLGGDNAYEVTVVASDGQYTDSMHVTVTVIDAGIVTLSSSQPRAGTPLTATLTEPDAPVSALMWQWEWSEEGSLWSRLDGATTATYTPSADDVGRYLRVRVSYTDSAVTQKALESATTMRVAARRRPPPPPPGRGGGGGGGPACAEDVHGNSATQATDVALDTVTTGAICPAADRDYFTVTVPGRSLVFVETTGRVNTRGTIWQDGLALASGPTGGRRQDARLGARVQAGTVVVAVQGQGGATGDYELVVTFVPSYLENPGPDSFQSGIGVLSGWVCEAETVEIVVNDTDYHTAAYGTARADTAADCGDTDNGFGLLFNWNLLDDGAHEVVAYVDNVELGQATVTVTTLGEEFVKDVVGTCAVSDFPMTGETVTLVWQESNQNFVIASGATPSKENRTGAADVGYLENPGPNSFQSGIGVISGWVCDAEAVEIEIETESGEVERLVAGYGTERLDTAEVCGDTDNGFGLLFNWNRLRDGEHTVVAFVDEVELGRATVRVTTLGQEFLRDVAGTCTVKDFPSPGETVRLEWQQNSQNFVIVSHDPAGAGP